MKIITISGKFPENSSRDITGHQQESLTPRSYEILFILFLSYKIQGLLSTGDWGVDLARPADQDQYLTQLPSYEYRDLVTISWLIRLRTTLVAFFALAFVDSTDLKYAFCSAFALLSLNSIPIAHPRTQFRAQRDSAVCV